MPLVVIPPTEASAYTDATPSPLDRAQKLVSTAQFGAGLRRPFQRDEKNDFANSADVELVKACVGQVLGMVGANPDNPSRQGELPWAPERGALLHLLRHQKNNFVLAELGRVYVIDALRRWEPRCRVRGVRVSRETGDEGFENILVIRLVYDIVANASNNQVLFSGVDQTLKVAA
jgi:phage baseplate assembly protein W